MNIFLDEFGSQIVVTNRIVGEGERLRVEYYGVNSETHERLTRYTRNEKEAERLLGEYAKGDLLRQPLQRINGWPLCFSALCLSCRFNAGCDGFIALQRRRKHGGYIPRLNNYYIRLVSGWNKNNGHNTKSVPRV